MTSFRVAALAAVATAAGVGWPTAVGAVEDAIKAELRRVAGTWQLTWAEKDGQKTPDDEVKQSQIVIAGEKYTLRRDGQVVEEGTVRIDPTRTPRTIDVFPIRPEGKVQLGIYEWDGEDRIRVCFTHPGTAQTRPTDFSTTRGTGHVLQVGQRERARPSR
jgi:uncharacterized protein (TIGR03067 family)